MYCAQHLFDNLSFWSRHHNRDVLHDGTLAFDAFLKQACTINNRLFAGVACYLWFAAVISCKGYWSLAVDATA